MNFCSRRDNVATLRNLNFHKFYEGNLIIPLELFRCRYFPVGRYCYGGTYHKISNWFPVVRTSKTKEKGETNNLKYPTLQYHILYICTRIIYYVHY